MINLLLQNKNFLYKAMTQIAREILVQEKHLIIQKYQDMF